MTGFWKIGVKLVNSEKTQDRGNANYHLAAGAANLFTLGDANPGFFERGGQPASFA